MARQDGRFSTLALAVVVVIGHAGLMAIEAAAPTGDTVTSALMAALVVLAAHNLISVDHRRYGHNLVLAALKLAYMYPQTLAQGDNSMTGPLVEAVVLVSSLFDISAEVLLTDRGFMRAHAQYLLARRLNAVTAALADHGALPYLSVPARKRKADRTGGDDKEWRGTKFQLHDEEFWASPCSPFYDGNVNTSYLALLWLMDAYVRLLDTETYVSLRSLWYWFLAWIRQHNLMLAQDPGNAEPALSEPSYGTFCDFVAASEFFIGAPKEVLGVIPETKTCLHGLDMVMRTADGRINMSISHLTELPTLMACDRLFFDTREAVETVIVVEKESALQLCTRFLPPQHLRRVLIVKSRGTFSAAACRLLWRLRELYPDSNFLVLADSNAGGLGLAGTLICGTGPNMFDSRPPMGSKRVEFVATWRAYHDAGVLRSPLSSTQAARARALAVDWENSRMVPASLRRHLQRILQHGCADINALKARGDHKQLWNSLMRKHPNLMAE